MNRFGLLVANTTFPEYPELARLLTPPNDVKGLEDALVEESRGKFLLETVLDSDSRSISDKIEGLIKTAAEKGALALIYYSGHGLLDPSNRLYLAARDSQSGRFARTVSIADIVTWIRIYRPRRVVILLDCCYSGAAGDALEMRGSGPASSSEAREVRGNSAISESLTELSQGEGVVMLTACSPIEQAGGSLTTGYGVFTHHVVNGIKTGKAAKQNQEYITVQDLFEYVSMQMRAEGAQQTPQLWNLQQIGQSLVLSEVLLKGTNATPIDPKLRWVVLNQERKPILDLVGPSYLLDNVFHFLDWNTSFDLLVARPLGLRRGTHVKTFLEKLKNWDQVRKRSNEKFPPGRDPLVDIETLVYESTDYGVIVFEKIAGQILGDNGQLKAWCINLNISSVQKKSSLWRNVESNLSRDLNWSRYAISYDKVIAKFPDYQQLVDMVVKKVGPALRCADLGCGTGNVTLRLLTDNIYTTVLAVDKNESMLDALQKKIDASSDKDRFKERTTLYKGDITTCLREQSSCSLDACIMLNVIFALQDPASALAEVYRVLSTGGILSLSTSHHETDIDALFNQVKAGLVEQHHWSDATEVAWKGAYERNVAMKDLIQRDSKEDILNYVTTAGFVVEEYHENEYVNCVVVIKAVKPAKKTQF